MPKIWEKQEYESKTSFAHFQKYYLLQPTPRSLTRAYRKFQEEKGKMHPNRIKKLYPSGSWNNWANGKDNQGNKIPGSKTWEERADEYDKNLFMLKEHDYAEARQKLLRREVNNVQDQLGLWDEISQSFALFIASQKNAASSEEKPFNPSSFIVKAKEIWKWRDEIAAFERRTLGLPAVIKEKPSDTDDRLTTIEWDEPLSKDDEIGMGKNELEKDKPVDDDEQYSN